MAQFTYKIMHAKLAFFFKKKKPPAEKRGKKSRDINSSRLPIDKPGPAARFVVLFCRRYPGGGNRLILRTSAALCRHPCQTAPTPRIHGKSEGLGGKNLSLGVGVYICRLSKSSRSPSRGHSQRLLSGQARTTHRAELN